MGDNVGLVIGKEAVVLQVGHDLGIEDLLEHHLSLGPRCAPPVSAMQRYPGGCHDAKNGDHHHELDQGKANLFSHLRFLSVLH